MHALITEIRKLEDHLATWPEPPAEKVKILVRAQCLAVTTHQHAVLSVAKMRLVRAHYLHVMMKLNEKQQIALESALAELDTLGEEMEYETAHIEADNTLCKLLTALGLTAVVEKYEDVDKRYA